MANVLFSRELSKRLEGTGVTSNSLHPGAVETELSRHLSIVKVIALPFKVFVKTPKSGAQTSIMLGMHTFKCIIFVIIFHKMYNSLLFWRVAVEPSLDNVSGKYFSDCKIVQESKLAQDDDTAAWLWEISEKITQLK